jgi:hypothetical protein
MRAVTVHSVIVTDYSMAGMVMDSSIKMVYSIVMGHSSIVIVSAIVSATAEAIGKIEEVIVKVIGKIAGMIVMDHSIVMDVICKTMKTNFLKLLHNAAISDIHHQG